MWGPATGAFRPGEASVTVVAQVQVPSTPVDGAAPPDDTGPEANQPIPAVAYCYTRDFTLKSKETAYCVKNSLCLSCLNSVLLQWLDCPLHNHSAWQNPCFPTQTSLPHWTPDRAGLDSCSSAKWQPHGSCLLPPTILYIVSPLFMVPLL